jgi:hypothetical protein
MPVRLLSGALGGIVFITLAGTASAGDQYDRCAYMHHESKAYKACLTEMAAPSAAPESATKSAVAIGAPKNASGVGLSDPLGRPHETRR